VFWWGFTARYSDAQHRPLAASTRPRAGAQSKKFATGRPGSRAERHRARLLDKEIDQTTLSCLVNFRQRADEEWFAERNPARHALGGNQTDKR
jgi:hypothetical protein